MPLTTVFHDLFTTQIGLASPSPMSCRLLSIFIEVLLSILVIKRYKTIISGAHLTLESFILSHFEFWIRSYVREVQDQSKFSNCTRR